VSTANASSALGFDWTPPLIQVVLPVGISFYTFMAISYVVDVHRRRFHVASWMDAFLYLAFFPHLVAGPIVRPDELIPQLDVRRDQRHLDVAGAGWLILGGLFKKVVISSYLTSEIVEPVFGDPSRHSALDVLVGVWGFAVVIYADFSGYTDIAIGVAQLLGFRFPQNFDRPYVARSIQDFWRRWHMTLSRWLRDYLYIPLGGNRRGDRRTAWNIAITMVLGGLWHGAAWTFVLWGAYHGALLVAHHVRAAQRPDPPEDTWLRVAGQRLATFALVCVGWVFFRADSVEIGLALLGRLVTGWTTPDEFVTPLVVLLVVGMLGLQFWPRGMGLWLQAGLSRLKPVPLGLVLAVSLLAIVILGPPGVAPFIYFQF
jgi:D-alanyl-lipoteichoic acid acyltransferase DltB (MBOAT superfamily)